MGKRNEKSVFLALVAALAVFAASGDDVSLVRDGRTFWAYSAQAGKPCAHPLSLPGGRVLTTTGDADHSWHHGLWFSWKFLNGVNFWEEDGAGRSDGEQRVRQTDVRRDGAAAEVTQEIDWGPRAEPDRTFLREQRTVSFSAPDASGGFVIDWTARFTACERTTVDRTPPTLHGDGHWSGGYAGFSLRLADGCRGFAVTTSSGATAQADIIARETGWIDYADPADGHGIRLEVVRAPGRRVFYHWTDHRFTNLSPVFDGPIVLEKGDTLELSYRATVH